MPTRHTPDDSIDWLIAERLPGWLRVARPDQVRALQCALARQEQVNQQLGELLAAIPRLDVFAERLLLAALREARVADTDVRNSTVTITEQVYYPSVAEKLYRPKGTRVTRQSLLAAALHNYHVSETRPLAGRKGVLTDAHGTVLGLGIEAFAGRCRALDVGGQYQTLLQRQLGTGDAQGKGSPAVRGLIEESLRAQLEVAVRLATLKGELSERHYLQLLPLMASVPIVPPVADAVVARQLYLLGKCIHGVFTFEVQHGDNPAEVIAYVPGMAQQPVRMHASWQAFYDWVAQWLNEAGPRAFFVRFILERDRLSFFQALNERLHSRPVGGAANLDGRNLAIDGGLFAHLRGLQLSKLFDDARMLARPTGDEDQADRQARLQGYESLAFDVLGVAGMFVPLLGEVMTVVFAAQIATEVYEGYEDWRLGDRKGALEHLFGVAENVAAGLLISGGVSAGMRALQRVPFVDELRPVVDSAGQLKLCSSELPGYAMDAVQQPLLGSDFWQLPEGGGLYRVEREPGSGSSFIRHPIRSEAYAPRIERTPSDGWRHALESPQEWQGVGYLMRRLSSRLAGLSDATATHLAQITGFDESHLRGLHLENAPVPARMLDVMERYQLATELAPLRGEALEARFNERQPALTSDEQLLIRDFPGLSVRGAREIFSEASGTQIDQLKRSRRVPLALAERARWWLRDSRLDKACTGLLLPQWASEDSARLALGLIDLRAPWSPEVRIELRAQSAQGRVLVAQGSEQAPRVKRIVRQAEGYALAGSEAEILPLLDVLASCLDPQQKTLLGSGAPFTTTRLRDNLIQAAASDRDQVARLLGLAPVGLGIRPPRRIADGRIGYPLSGRGDSSRRAMRRGIHQIFPTLSDEQLQAYVLEVITRREGLWAHYRGLQEQLAALRQNLNAWQRAGGTPLEVLQRRRVATHIRRSWRRKISNDGGEYVLILDGERVGSLPQLPAGVSFSHIRRLVLRSMELAALDEAFLERFPNLVELNLSDNRLVQVPAGVERLEQLRQLHLSRNSIVLNSVGEQRLRALTRLQVLDLCHNPLGRAPELMELRNLRDVRLRSTGLATIPERVTWRALVDLRDNQIQTVRQDLEVLRARVDQLALHDNPLDSAGEQRLDDAAEMAQAGARGSIAYRHHPLDDAVRDQWLGTRLDDLYTRRKQSWNTLRQETEAAGLMRFLSDFASSEDFQSHPGHFRKRIWHILDACEQHEQLRLRVFQEASGQRTCEDRLLLVLEQLELAVLVERATANLPPAHVEGKLLRLAQSLFRLDEVDRIATRHIERMHRSGEALVDEVEVRLYYRLKLRTMLDLPIEADEMHYESYANVTTSDLLRARSDVLAAQNPASEIAALSQRPFWEAHVRERYPERLEAQLQPVQLLHEQNEADLEAGHIDEWTYVKRSNGLMHEYELAERRVFTTLAREVYERLNA
ncbi:MULTISPECIES: NEL-type E3 ubiquitin ligase domain-containing protein [Pseudomonas]|uniref:RING-type E3 ubiquitin transferase n=1 Tax=Pseudomonas monteilii TaxID=76759 RepID=A0A7X3F5G5_9PSED|nr:MULTISPECIES: NEL-type E3 ubiquitin ligase domain-containing protein [Pseudomonas]MBA6139969.1 hypothetical protein [Pseudomonas monteilii]MCA4074285.1 hypothetical protein [Pseudomonas kurunegalensis]MDT3749449.1 NEL-type E3 ubiquitin ligase domain-containing protein [Pseudomonas kurunegalensis]MVF51504.1 hypothetical protein [Pseudomonas monteilii]